MLNCLLCLPSPHAATLNIITGHERKLTQKGFSQYPQPETLELEATCSPLIAKQLPCPHGADWSPTPPPRTSPAWQSLSLRVQGLLPGAWAAHRIVFVRTEPLPCLSSAAPSLTPWPPQGVYCRAASTAVPVAISSAHLHGGYRATAFLYENCVLTS